MRVKKQRVMVALLVGVIQGAAWAQPYADRWFYNGWPLTNEKEYAALTQLVTRAAAAHFNGIVDARGVELYWYSWSAKRKELFRRYAAFCREKGVEVIPLIWSTGYGSMTGVDSSLYETKRVAGIPYVRRGDALAFEDHRQRLKNPDFEVADLAKNKFEGWGTEAPGSIGYVDEQVVHAGKRSVRMEKAPGKDKYGHARVYQTVKLEPNRRYRYSVWARVKDEASYNSWDFSIQIITKEAAAQHAGCQGKLIRHLKPGEWRQYSAVFTTGASGETFIFMGNWSKTETTTFWFDDARLEQMPLEEVAIGADIPFAVVNAATRKPYVCGRDYLAPVWKDRALCVRLPATTTIKEGEAVLVEAYVRAHAGIKGQCSSCMSNPKLYDYFRKSAIGIQEACQPRKWFLSMDEIANGGTCPRCKARKTDMAHIVAGCVLKQHEIIRSVNPTAKIYAWSDAFDPWHNAKEHYSGCEGSFIGIWDLISRDISLVCWYFDKREQSVPFFASRGFGIVAGAFYDAKDLSRDAKWVETLNRTTGATGLLYTTWNNNYSQLENFGHLIYTRGQMLERDVERK